MKNDRFLTREFRRIGQCRHDRFRHKRRVFRQKTLLGHTRRQVVQHHGDRNSSTGDTRNTVHDPGVQRKYGRANSSSVLQPLTKRYHLSDAAEMNESVESDAFVLPSQSSAAP